MTREKPTNASEGPNPYPEVTKVRGHVARSDVVYLSKVSGAYTLFHFDPATSESRQLRYTDEPVTDSPLGGDFAVHPTKPWVFMTKDRDGDRQCDLLLIDVSTNAARTLAEQIGCVHSLKTYREASAIAATTTADSLRLLQISIDGNTRVLHETDQQMASLAVSDRHGRAFISVGRRTTALLSVDVETGEVQTWIEPGVSRQGALAVDEEAGLLAHALSVEGEPERLVIRSIDSGNVVAETTVPGDVGFFVQDSGYLAWADPETVVVSIGNRGICTLRTYDLGTDSWSESLVNGVAEYLARTSNGVLFSASSHTFSNSLHRFLDGRVETLTEPKRQTDTVPESVTFTSFDGEEIQGWLTRADDEAERLAVVCHGGPTYADVNMWGSTGGFIALLRMMGFHVFQPNFRGSTSFGARFMNLNVGDIGGADLQDVLCAAREISRRLGIETKPIIMGASYGGYLTLLAMTTQPDEWGGGVAVVPVADLKHSYELADSHYKRFTEHFLDGTPEEKPDLYRERSPITHIEGLRGPLLVYAGESDPAAAFAPVKCFVDRAEELGKEVTFLSTRGGHGIGDKKTGELLYEGVHVFLERIVAEAA